MWGLVNPLKYSLKCMSIKILQTLRGFGDAHSVWRQGKFLSNCSITCFCSIIFRKFFVVAIIDPITMSNPVTKSSTTNCDHPDGTGAAATTSKRFANCPQRLHKRSLLSLLGGVIGYRWLSSAERNASEWSDTGEWKWSDMEQLCRVKDNCFHVDRQQSSDLDLQLIILCQGRRCWSTSSQCLELDRSLF